MPAAVPDYFSGATATTPDKHADGIMRLAGWIRRRSNELIAATDLDVGKLYALCADCFQVTAIVDLYRAGDDIGSLKEALVAKTREIGVGNPSKTTAEIQADWLEVYQAITAFLSWCSSALPDAGDPVTDATVVVNRRWPNPDFTISVTKLAAVQNQLIALRAAFV